MSGAIRKMGQYDTVREAAGSPVPTPPQAGACTCSFCSAVQKLQLALVTAPLEGTMGLQRSHCERKGIVHPILLSL